MCMFYIIVNIETLLNGWNKVVTSHGLLHSQVNKQANMMFLMDGGRECLIMDVGLHAHGFLNKRPVTVLLACIF